MCHTRAQAANASVLPIDAAHALRHDIRSIWHSHLFFREA